MNTDQQLLYLGCQALINGCPENLKHRTLGNLSHARWLTTAIRIVFLYMSTENPSPALCRLTWFVLNCYSILWLNAKQFWRATEAPLIAFKAMKIISELPVSEQNILRPVFERGFTYWLHAEQLLLGCLGSQDADIRARAVARVLHIRNLAKQQVQPTTTKRKRKRVESLVRIFKLPTPKYDADDFSTMIDWETEQMTEPPYLRKFTDEQLRQFETTPLSLDVPSNSQFVERYIRLITEKGTLSSSPSTRDGLCKATLRHRNSFGKAETKSDYTNAHV